MISYLDSKGRELIFQQTQPGLKLITLQMQVKMNNVWLWSETERDAILSVRNNRSLTFLDLRHKPRKGTRPAECCGAPRSARARVPTPARWVSLGTFPNSSKPQFPWSVSWEKQSLFDRAPRGQNEAVCGKGLAQCQARSKRSINLSWYYSHDWKRTSGFF